MIEFNSLFRNSADPFVNGSMRSSNSEQYLSRVAEPEDFDLKNGLNDLSNVVSISLEKLFIYFCFMFINLKTSMSNLRVKRNTDFKKSLSKITQYSKNGKTMNKKCVIPRLLQRLKSTVFEF